MSTIVKATDLSEGMEVVINTRTGATALVESVEDTYLRGRHPDPASQPQNLTFGTLRTVVLFVDGRSIALDPDREVTVVS